MKVTVQIHSSIAQCQAAQPETSQASYAVEQDGHPKVSPFTWDTFADVAGRIASPRRTQTKISLVELPSGEQ